MTPSPRRRRRRRRDCSPEAGPLGDDDLLREILLRLPPLPSSLPRAALVCKRWRSLASDPAFSKLFRIHHRRNPALLGFFGDHPSDPFQPTLEAPNRVPPCRFSFKSDGYRIRILGCRHGLLLMLDPTKLRLLVCDPVTGDQHSISMAVPLRFHPKHNDSLFPRRATDINGAVLRAAGNGHRFLVVLVMADDDCKHQRQALACVYSSETGVWGNVISASIPSEVIDFFPKRVSVNPAVLVGGSLYWTLTPSIPYPIRLDFLEFDLGLGSHKLDLIKGPSLVGDFRKLTVLREDGGGLGLLSVSHFTAKLWKRKADSDSWELQRTIDLNKLLSLNLDKSHMVTLRFAEDNNLLVVGTIFGLFTVQLQSLKFKKLSENRCLFDPLPFESVYTGEIGTGGGHALMVEMWLSRYG